MTLVAGLLARNALHWGQRPRALDFAVISLSTVAQQPPRGYVVAALDAVVVLLVVLLATRRLRDAAVPRGWAVLLLVPIAGTGLLPALLLLPGVEPTVADERGPYRTNDAGSAVATWVGRVAGHPRAAMHLAIAASATFAMLVALPVGFVASRSTGAWALAPFEIAQMAIAGVVGGIASAIRDPSSPARDRRRGYATAFFTGVAVLVPMLAWSTRHLVTILVTSLLFTSVMALAGALTAPLGRRLARALLAQ